MKKERYSIAKLQADINNLTPKEKIAHLEKHIQTYNYWKNYEGKNHTGQIYEYGVYEEVKKIMVELENDNSLFYTHDLKYYYNPENIPNQEAVFATWDFLEHT